MQAIATTDKKTGWGILIASLAFFIILFFITHPFFKYYIDPDAVSYLTIARRYATGDCLRAINGLWSPFSPWLVSLCMRAGMEALWAAHFMSALASIGTLIAAFCLFRRYNINAFITTVLMLALPIVLVHNMYFQLFDEPWEVFFLLCYLLVVTSNRFLDQWWKWLLCGVLAAFAFFAKTYAFYFSILHLIVTVLILSKQQDRPFKGSIKVIATFLITMLLVMSPWLYMLHKKYGKWGIGYVGPINASWTLTGHKTFKPGIKELIPPPYSDSPWNMEDPIQNEGHLYSLWESPRFIPIQAARSGYAIIQGLYVVNEISFLLFTILFATAVVVFSKKDQQLFDYKLRILLWAGFIMPLGYCFMHFESRFVWLLIYVSMVLGAVWLMRLQSLLPVRAYRLLVLVLALSYVVYPVFDSRTLFHKGKDIYDRAQEINKLGLHGSYTANSSSLSEGETAYLTGMQYYTIEHFEFSQQKLLAEMRRYHVRYYFFYGNQPDMPSVQMNDEQGRPFPEMTHGAIPGLKVFLINP